MPLFSLFCTVLTCCQVLKPTRGPRQDRGTEANQHHHPPTGPPNKTRNTTSPAAPMVPECSRCSRCSQPCTIKQDAREEAHKDRGTRDKPTRNARKSRSIERDKGQERERERAGATSPQANKERGTPPHSQLTRRCFPHHKFAPKNQQKVAWGSYEKIFGKIFRGNVSGKRKTPRVISTEGGMIV